MDMIESPYEGLAAKHNYAVCHGDLIEAIAVDDPRYDIRTTKEPFPLKQMKDAVDMLKPIRSKLIALLEGNHEWKLWRFGDISAEMASMLKVPFGTYSCKLIYKDKHGGLIYKHYATHGRKMINSTADDPERRESNMKLILKRHLKMKQGDALLMSKGHTHKLLVCEPKARLYLKDDGYDIKQAFTQVDQTAEYIPENLRWYVNTGAFQKMSRLGISGYAERAEMDPIELGWAVVVVRDRKIIRVDKIRPKV